MLLISFVILDTVIGAMNAAADSICFQVFEEFKVEGWIVVDNETELFGGACDDAVKVAERIVGGVAGLEMAGWIIEEAAVEDDSNFVKFHAAGVAQIGGDIIFQRDTGASGEACEQGPALFSEIGASSAEVIGFVEIIQPYAGVCGMMRGAATVKEVGDKGGKGAVGADLGGKGFG